MIPDTTIENQDYYLRSGAGAGAVDYRNNNRQSRPSHRSHHNYNNSKQVYSNLIEAKNNSLILTATSKLNNKMKNKTKKPLINITSSYAIENDNFIMGGNNMEIFSNNLHNHNNRHHNQKEESDEYYDYLELKQQLFNSSIKTQQQQKQQQIEDLSPARQRLNNLNKNLHTMIKNKRLKSAGAKSTCSVEAALSSSTKTTTPATFYDNPQLQLLNTSPRPSLKQPQILNMKFKSANADSPPSANNSIKSKPSSASTHHSSNRFVFFSNY